MQISISNIVKGTVIGSAFTAISRYFTRVTQAGAIYEKPLCVESGINSSPLLQQASMLMIPSGYKGGTAYAELPSNGNGDLTWTRGSDAFRTNASGVLQRVPWNLLQRSEEFDNAIWIKSSVTVTSNQATSPDGNLTADLLTPTGSDCVIRQSITPSSVSAYTFSVWLRSATGSDISTTIRVWRDSPFQNITNTAITVTSTWQRFTLNFTPIDLTSHAVVIGGSSTLSSGENLFAYGAQLVEGTTAQTYLPTTDRLNFPRLSYMYGSCPSALLEPQRTNLALYSQDFDNSYWVKNQSATVTANTTTSPDGTTNADTLSVAALSFSGIYRAISGASANYTISIYAKKNTKNWLYLFDATGAVARAWFNLDSGVLGTVASGYTATITSVGNGWYRCTLTNTTATSASYYQFGLSDSDNSTTPTSSGSAYIFGAQLEAGAYPTTYISTTSATATRVADSFSRNNIYTNGLITASGGTWFVELRGNISYVRDSGGFGISLANNNTTYDFGFLILTNAGGAQRISILKRVSGVGTSIYTTTTDTTKIAIKWNGSTADVFANGTKVVSATSFTTTQMELLTANILDTPKFIQQMALHPEPLTDAKLIELTTL